MHFCFRKRIHHQMERAAVDGRGGAVHSHGALHAPVRTADSELRRPSQTKRRTTVAPRKGSSTVRGEEPGKRWFLKYISSRIFRGGARCLRSRKSDYGALMDRECARERLTGNEQIGLRPTDTNLSPIWNGFRFCLIYCLVDRTVDRRESDWEIFHNDSEVLCNFILIKRSSRRWYAEIRWLCSIESVLRYECRIILYENRLHARDR